MTSAAVWSDDVPANNYYQQGEGRGLLICVINGKGETLHAQRDDTEYNNIIVRGTVNLSHYSMIYMYDNFFMWSWAGCNFHSWHDFAPNQKNLAETKLIMLETNSFFCFRKQTKGLHAGYISLLQLPFLFYWILLEGGILFSSFEMVVALESYLVCGPCTWVADVLYFVAKCQSAPSLREDICAELLKMLHIAHSADHQIKTIS